MADAAGHGVAEPGAKILVVGISLSESCGVRDHARLLATALADHGPPASSACAWHWLRRRERSLRGARAEVGAWTRELGDALRSGTVDGGRPDAVLLHYSVFAYAHKGVPVFVRPLLSALRAGSAPVVTVLHEYAYPWRARDWRALTWAVSQRALLVEVMRISSGAIVAGEARARWLRSRAWLPRRDVLVAPVFSNLPPPAGAGPPPARREPVVGLFGYSYQGAAVALIMEAIAAVRARGIPVRLALLGAPGAASAAGELWLAQARARGLREAVSFTGTLPAQELADELAACEVLLFADAAGPTPRKGTLAGSLASGRPVVAIDGPQTWDEPVRRQAIRLAPPSAEGLAQAIALLLADETACATLGAAGRAFAQERMSVQRTATAARELILNGRGTGPPPDHPLVVVDQRRAGKAGPCGRG